MPNNAHFSKCFWGAASAENFQENVKALIWSEFGSLSDTFMGDNLIAIGRNLSFLNDEKFMEAFRSVITPDNVPGQGIIWRIYTLCWAAKTSLKRGGDFVECGVSTGTSAKIMCEYLNSEDFSNNVWLYDVFRIDPRVDTSIYFGSSSSILDEVTGRFAPFPNVRIVPGYVPESFELNSPASISFLHLDLHDTASEIAALDALFDRVTPGGIVLFDDYGATGFQKQKAAEDEWMERRGQVILELPTGQGLVVKL
ncbi:hypothetical protein BC360_30130 [Ensifer sp. LC163]|nr:hypothetical protein BC360_30130 [Ensifer sp. LC163]